jgi:hypothetical protein
MIGVDGGETTRQFSDACRQGRGKYLLDSFLQELNDVEQMLGRKPLLIAMGGKNNTLDVRRWAKDANLLNGYEIKHITHYSARGPYQNPENYRNKVWEELEIKAAEPITSDDPHSNGNREVAERVNRHRNATRSGEHSQQRRAFWNCFRDWCKKNNKACGTRAVHPDGMSYYDISNITVKNDHLKLRFTVGDENGAQWVATEIYCKDGQEQRNRIAQYRAQFEASIFGDSAPDQDWDSPPPHPNTIARVVRFIRRADWRNADKAPCAQMCADYEAIRKILKTIEK